MTGTVVLLGDAVMAMPGDGVKIRASLQRPFALSGGDRFAVREGGKIVGSGVVAGVDGRALTNPHRVRAIGPGSFSRAQESVGLNRSVDRSAAGRELAAQTS